MGIEALYRKRNTSKRHPDHQVFPYLLRNVVIDRPNHVRAADITYIPMRCGFIYLFAILEWATRKVLVWSVSISLTTDFCIAALEAAIAEYSCPKIINTDQDSQFKSNAFVDVFEGIAAQLSMGGRAGGVIMFSPNASGDRSGTKKFIFTLMRLPHMRGRGIAGYIAFYNRERPHSSLDKQTPDEAYYKQPTLQVA